MDNELVVIGGEGPLTRLLCRRLGDRSGDGPGVEAVRSLHGPAPEVAQALAASRPASVVYLAGERREGRGRPHLEDAAACLQACADAGVERVVVVASAMVHPPSHHHLGLVSEERVSPRAEPESPAGRWLALEGLARERLGGDGGRLILLRPTAVPVAGGRDLWSRLLARRWAPVVAGFDPAVQLLAPEDLAAAVSRALGAEPGGVYHVAPAAALPLRRAVRRAGGRPLPLPGWLLRLLFPSARGGLLPYLCWSWTVSGEEIRRELGFTPRHTSAQAAQALAPSPTAQPHAAGPQDPSPRIQNREGGGDGPDDFGLDPAYIRRWSRLWFPFLHDLYWRVEVQGVENVPRGGRAVLVGMHRGFMPFDGVMAFYHVARERGRHLRFLLHPCLLKFPFLFDHMTKLGGVPACQENAQWVLEREELLGIFPEGIRGAFTYYREAYRLGRFGRDEFVRIALRHRAPLIPFVTVGSAEIFPIVGRLDWRWVKRLTEWPFLPVTLSLPMIPLPSKWHTRYLPPLHVEEEYPPEAADDPEVVTALSGEVRRRMQEAVDGMLARRRHVLFGSIFPPEVPESGEPS